MRTHEIVESPYFNHFTNFTADIDKFYRDVTDSDTISFVYKYSKILIKFIRDKYFSFVPFGQELQNVAIEITTELNELKKLPSVYYITTKWEEVYTKMRWLYEYLDIDNHVKYVFDLVRSKMFSVPQTALQAENRYIMQRLFIKNNVFYSRVIKFLRKSPYKMNIINIVHFCRYREAKTKFIYDPYEGIIYFEQKLPVSWHAFNETPELKVRRLFKRNYILTPSKF